VENHRFKIVWSEPAKRDFEKIIAQIAENAPMRAAAFGKGLTHAVESLKWSPYRCPPLYESPICRYLLFKKYRIAFHIYERKRTVQVIAFLFPYQQFDMSRFDWLT
jgi:plasmid stabilization system protein ParE